MMSLNIRFKLSLFIVALLIMTTLVFSFSTVKTMNQYILNEVVKRAEALSKSISALAAYSILSGDLLGVDHIVSKIKAVNPDIEHVAIVGNDGRILAHSDIDRRGRRFSPAYGPILKKEADGTVLRESNGTAKRLFEASTPIAFNGKRVGTMVIHINKSVLLEAQAVVQMKILAGLAVSLFIGIACGVFLSSFLTRPIKELSAGVDELKKGTGARPLRVYSRDELGRLTKSFNEMSATITDQSARLGKYAHDLEEAYVSIVRVLAAAIDARDPYTHGHSTRVAKLALRMGEALGLSKVELEDLELASLLHDIGKLKTPDSILYKESSHSEAEYRSMMQHPEYGAEILSRAASLHKYMPAVRHHHEWYNGAGYPDGLKAGEIPIFASIIAVADAFDAMTSTRPYRKALSKKVAMEELILTSGRQFDPALVEIFLRVVDNSPLAEDESCSAGNVSYE